MELDIRYVPFCMRGSYMIVSYLTEDFRLFGRKIADEGLYLRSARGAARQTPLIAKLVPLLNGNESAYRIQASESYVCLRLIDTDACIRITFADANTILMEGKGKGAGLALEGIADAHSIYDYVLKTHVDGLEYYEANEFRTDSRYILMNQKGRKKLFQNWDVQTSRDTKVIFEEENGAFLSVIEEAHKEWKPKHYDFDFDTAMAGMRRMVQDFVDTMPEVPADLGNLKEQAGYINWCSQVAKDGTLTRDAVYPSKNWMFGAFAWDHCFIARVLSFFRPREAWEQFMILFDYQDETGRIPDAVTDSSAVWNFVKPPVHGWTLLRLMEHMELTGPQVLEAYEKLSKWTNWWYTFRDTNRNGLCAYHHGNDSGWDNATVFRDSMCVESPDLAADLVLQTQCLAKLAAMLGSKEEEADWKEKSQRQLEVLLARCFVGNKPVALDEESGEVIDCDSLLPYTVIILGDQLPKEKRDYIVHTIRTEFLTPYGLATEKTTSPFYSSDGYWRGPVWAPTTLMVTDGLERAGEWALAREIARRFVSMVQKSGFPENFDSRTGGGNRDRAFTWTASVFLILSNRYLLDATKTDGMTKKGQQG